MQAWLRMLKRHHSVCDRGLPAGFVSFANFLVKSSRPTDLHLSGLSVIEFPRCEGLTACAAAFHHVSIDRFAEG